MLLYHLFYPFSLYLHPSGTSLKSILSLLLKSLRVVAPKKVLPEFYLVLSKIIHRFYGSLLPALFFSESKIVYPEWFSELYWLYWCIFCVGFHNSSTFSDRIRRKMDSSDWHRSGWLFCQKDRLELASVCLSFGKFPPVFLTLWLTSPPCLYKSYEKSRIQINFSDKLKRKSSKLYWISLINKTWKDSQSLKNEIQCSFSTCSKHNDWP